jgi:hypothetical protein
MWSPMGIAFDRSGNLLVSDTYNQRVRRVNASSGVIETIAGTGVAGAHMRVVCGLLCVAPPCARARSRVPQLPAPHR